MGRTETVELWMCRLAGLPVSESWDRPPGPPALGQIAVVTSCVLGSAAVASYYAIEPIQAQYAYDFTTYQNLNEIVYSVSAAYVTLNMASGDRSAPTRLAVRAERVREAMITHGLGVAATNLCRLASRFLLAMILMNFFNGFIRDWMVLYNIIMTSTSVPYRGFYVLEFIVKMRNHLLFWTTTHRSASQPLAELGIIEDVMRELPTEPEPEAEDEPGPEEDPGRPRPRPPPLTVHRCRLLIALCDQANKLRLESNRWLHVPSCIMMFFTAWFIPLLLKWLVSEPSDTRLSLTAGVVTGLILKLAPLCCAQLVKHRRDALVRKAAREAKRAEDPELRRALNKLKIHAEEMFPDSPCVLLDFDLSFLPVLVNVVVLVTTTFFQRDST